MTDTDLLPLLLFKINENQLALEAAILEISNWIGNQGPTELTENIRGALATIDKNEEYIKMTLAIIMEPE